MPPLFIIAPSYTSAEIDQQFESFVLFVYFVLFVVKTT
jgi:hypothetical protein